MTIFRRVTIRVMCFIFKTLPRAKDTHILKIQETYKKLKLRANRDINGLKLYEILNKGSFLFVIFNI